MQSQILEILSIEDAVYYLEQEAKIRSLRDKLDEFSKGRDLKKILVEGLLKFHPDMKKDSVEHKVRGWLDQNNLHSVKKMDAIEIAFILGLDIEETDQFVAMISEEKLHWRSPDEIVYIFALQNKIDFLEARALAEKLSEELRGSYDSPEPPEENYTDSIRKSIMELSTMGELEAFLRRESGRLGRYHNSAYRMFKKMMNELEHPKIDGMESFGKETLTIRQVIREYFYGDNVLYARNLAVKTKKGRVPKGEEVILTRVQQSIIKSWPDETTISKMKKRNMDVTRKVMILLFLATDPGWVDEEDFYEATEEEVFADLHSRLDHMLNLCGFAEIDPRVPFDWLILYCICVPDMLDVDERMRNIFTMMYGKRKEE